MKSIHDFNIFNSINPDALMAQAKKPMPFPLENFDEIVADCYNKVEQMQIKLEASKQNSINNTPARKRRIKTLLYKVKTCKSILKEVDELKVAEEKASTEGVSKNMMEIMAAMVANYISTGKVDNDILRKLESKMAAYYKVTNPQPETSEA